MKQDAYLHDVDLGSRLDPEAEKLTLHLMSAAAGLRVVLHRLRDQAATADRMGRQTPENVNSLEYRAYHAGAADAAEEIFWGIWRDMNEVGGGNSEGGSE